jgi:L-type amino acid transporter 8
MYALINYVGFATWLSIGMAIVCLLYLRKTRPEMPRPIKVHIVWPIIYTIVTVYLVILPLYASPVETGKKNKISMLFVFFSEKQPVSE